ncbi:MAG: putative Thiol-disulfide oxidoreductase [Acidimicrobiia bacterium]|nr:putative Thiol-disulfide oxidoreductase [Acidimicrobiia bacterium]
MAAVLVVVAAVAWSQRGSSGPDKIAADPSGKALMNPTLLALDGSSVHLDRYQGKPLVVNFWAESCGPCRQEMPAFEKVSHEVGSRVAIVGVNSGDPLDVTTKYVHEVGVTYDIVRDPKQDYVGSKQVLAFPTTLFVNASGRIVSTHVGAMSADDLSSQIKALFG